MRSCSCSYSCSRTCTCANSCPCFVVVILSRRRAHANIVCSMHLGHAFLVPPRIQGSHTIQAKTGANAAASAHAPLAATEPPPQRPPLLLLHLLLRLVIYISIYYISQYIANRRQFRLYIRYPEKNDRYFCFIIYIYI